MRAFPVCAIGNELKYQTFTYVGKVSYLQDELRREMDRLDLDLNPRIAAGVRRGEPNRSALNSGSG